MSAGAVGILAVAATASDQNKLAGNKGANGLMDPAMVMSAKGDDTTFKFAFEQNLGPVIVNRGSPNLGGGCQLANNTNGFNYTSGQFAIADNFNVATTGQLTGVSWSAAYRANAAAPFANGTPPASESFVIRILNDNAGIPGTEVFNTTVNNPLRTDSGTTLGTAPALTIWDYQATGLAGPVLNANTCYWLEIRNTSTLVAPTNVSFWVTAGAVPGDIYSMIDDTPSSIAGCAGYDVADQVAADLTFCLNLALNNLDGVNCPIAPLPTPCVNSAVNGTGIDSASNVGFNSASPGSLYPGTITGVFQRAENFTVSTGGNLQSVCFWGFFLGTGLTANSCARDFDLILWANTPATGLPSGTILNVGGTGDKVGLLGVTQTRSIDASGDEVFTVNLPAARQIALAANTCLHLTISNQFDTTVAARSARFVWGTTPAATVIGGPNDNRFSSRAIPSGGTPGAWVATTAADNRFNLSYILNVGPATSTVCIPPPPGNDACAGAVTLPLNGTPVNGSNVNAAFDNLPGTAFDLVDGAAVWYTFIGDGNDVTISTCNAGSALDSVLHVFCANSCAGPFNRVGGNDDAAPACGSGNAFASTVTVPTINGQRYYVVVNGFQGAQNTFILTATSGAASNPVPTCTPNCDMTGEASTVAEADACGAGTGLDNNNTCATASVYPALGDVARGSVSTTSGNGGTRDIDIWRMPASSAGQTVAVRIRSENPVLVQFLNNPTNDCANIGTTGSPFTVTPNTTFGIAACLAIGDDIFEFQLPATGTNYFLITAPSFGGSDCALGLDEYRFSVVAATLGACCIVGNLCDFTTLTACAAASTGDPMDFFAPNVACSVNPCDSQPGKCCLADGSCQLTPNSTIGNAASCATAGGTYTQGGVCTPNTCAASLIACCQGSNCTLLASSACTGPNTLATTATACNAILPATPNYFMPCCKADYNHVGGVTVQDIFDFLAGYFATNPFADANGSGNVTVQDIFDFLAAYFQGGGPCGL